MLEPALLVLETLINKCLSTDLQTLARLQELDGKTIKLDISDWNLSFYMLPKHHGIECRKTISSDPDTIISGTLQNLFKVGIAQDKHQAIKHNKIQFSGDAHTGIAMQQVLSNLDIDWEAHIANIVGDTPAHLLGQGFKKALNFGKSVVSSLQRNTDEYIHHEAKLCPTPSQLETFYQDINKLRNDVERLEAKINHLKSKRAPA